MPVPLGGVVRKQGQGGVRSTWAAVGAVEQMHRVAGGLVQVFPQTPSSAVCLPVSEPLSQPRPTCPQVVSRVCQQGKSSICQRKRTFGVCRTAAGRAGREMKESLSSWLCPVGPQGSSWVPSSSGPPHCPVLLLP